jgi:hypothetical protein
MSRGAQCSLVVVASIVIAALAYVYLIVLREPTPVPGQVAKARPKPARAESARPRLFAPSSVWNAQLPDDAEIDPQSNLLADALRDAAKSELTSRTGPYLATKGSVPVYTVSTRVRRVPVRLDVASDFRTSLSETFAAGVPIPAKAKPADNPDRSMVVWQPSTDRMWEFFAMRKARDGWHARWGGAMRNVSRSDGRYGPHSWPGASRRWGATATSLPLVAGLILTSELRAGRIDHALALSVGRARQGLYSWPAQRTDGVDPAPTAIPEGARFRIDPRLDLSKRTMPRETRVIALAAQRYGIIVNNQTGGGLSFWAEDPTRFGINARTAFFEGQYPTAYLRSFPWDHLQLLKMHLHRWGG